jgi:hypothetical protein
MTPEELLTSWGNNPEKEVFIQLSMPNITPTTPTYRGILRGEPGTLFWTLYADEVTSPLRGVALNLHHYDKVEAWGGDGRPYTINAQKSDGPSGLTCVLNIYDFDPFENPKRTAPIIARLA